LAAAPSDSLFFGAVYKYTYSLSLTHSPPCREAPHENQLESG